MFNCPHTCRAHRSGVSLTEVVASLVVLAVLTAIGISALNSTKTSTSDKKLESDVRTLNRAVAAYLSNGGKIAESDSQNKVLRLLKSETSTMDKKQLVGIAGPFVDLRTSGKPARTPGKERIVWISADQRFDIAIQGSGWESLHLLEDESLADHGTEPKRTGFSYAAVDTWVWDYKDRSLHDSGEFVGAGHVDSRIQLNPPVIDPPSGVYHHTAFPLNVIVENQNPPGSSVVMLSLDGDPWIEMTESSLTLPLSLYTRVGAYASSISPEFIDSRQVGREYQSSFIQFTTEIRIKDAKGEPWAVFNYTGADTALLWGKVVSPSGAQSSLRSLHDGSYKIGSGESQEIGILDYFNGTTKAGSNVEECSVEVTVSVTFPQNAVYSREFPVRIGNTIHYPGLPVSDHVDSLAVSLPQGEALRIPILNQMHTLHIDLNNDLQEGAVSVGEHGELIVQESESGQIAIVASLE